MSRLCLIFSVSVQYISVSIEYFPSLSDILNSVPYFPSQSNISPHCTILPLATQYFPSLSNILHRILPSAIFPFFSNLKLCVGYRSWYLSLVFQLWDSGLVWYTNLVFRFGIPVWYLPPLGWLAVIFIEHFVEVGYSAFRPWWVFKNSRGVVVTSVEYDADVNGTRF